MVFVNPNKLSFLIVQSAVAVLSAAFYQKEYSGYLFTTSSFSGSEYRTQTDAQYWCNLNGSKLLAITNSSIQSAAVTFINDAKQQNQLLVYYDIITDGQRTNDNWKWINETFSISLVIQGRSGDNFVYLYTTPRGYTLNAAQPTDTYYYICEFAGQTSCINGYPNGDQCFQSFSNEYVTWYKARNRCLLMGGDLATFEFFSSNDDFSILNGSWINPWTKYWIGLRRQRWTWETIDSDVTYSQWAYGEPNYYSIDNFNCLCIVPNDWIWRVCRCTDTAQFVCIRASSSSATVGTTTLKTTSVNSISQSSSTLNNFIPQSSSSTPAIQNETNALSNTSDKGSTNNSLAIGVGVGVGGGVLLIILIIVLILLSRKGYISFPRKSTAAKDTPSSSSPPPSDVIGSQPPNAIYAPICRSNEGFQDDFDSNQTTAEYAPLQIVDAIAYSKHHTLPPPAMNGPNNTEL